MSTELDELEAILSPLHIDEFLATSWTRNPVLIPCSERRSDLLTERVGQWSLESLIEGSRQPVQALLRDRVRYHSHLLVDPKEAIKLYDAGIALYITDSPLLDWLADCISRGLGVPSSKMRGQAFAARKGNHTGYHYDAADNFTFQMTGRKIWNVIPNAYVQHPLDNYLLTDKPSPDTRFALSHVFPRELPGAATSFDLTPGTMFYLPRGYWHSVDTLEEDTISLTLSYSPLTWQELLEDRVRTLLIADERWRAPAVVAGSVRSEERGRQGAEIVSSLLLDLQNVIGRMRPADILRDLGASSTPPSHRARFRRNQFACLNWSVDGGSTRRASILQRGIQSETLTDFEFDEVSANMIEWILKRPEGASFGVEDVVTSAHPAHCTAADAFGLLSSLADAGLLSYEP